MAIFEVGQSRRVIPEANVGRPTVDLNTLKEKPVSDWTEDERNALLDYFNDRKSSSGVRPMRRKIFEEFGIDALTLQAWQEDRDANLKSEEETLLFETITSNNFTVERAHSEPTQALSSEERLIQEIMSALNDIVWSNMPETEREYIRRDALLRQMRIDETRAHHIDLYSVIMDAATDILRPRWQDPDPLERSEIRERIESVWKQDPIFTWVEDMSTNCITFEREQLPTDADLHPVELIAPTPEPEPIPTTAEANELSIEDRNKMIEELIEELAQEKVGNGGRNRQSLLLTALRQQQNFPDLALAVSWYVHYVLDNSDLSVEYWKEDFPGMDNKTIQECIVRALVRIAWFMRPADLNSPDNDFHEKLFNEVIAELKKITEPSN